MFEEGIMRKLMYFSGVATYIGLMTIFVVLYSTDHQEVMTLIRTTTGAIFETWASALFLAALFSSICARIVMRLFNGVHFKELGEVHLSWRELIFLFGRAIVYVLLFLSAAYIFHGHTLNKDAASKFDYLYILVFAAILSGVVDPLLDLIYTIFNTHR
jgi:H+/Cl- antiporter ClcA